MVFIIAADRPCDLITEDDADEPITCILDKTPFYGEMGGQVGDTGELVGDGFRFEVVDAQVNGALILHRGHLREGRMELGRRFPPASTPHRRDGIRRAHSATHLLHYALRKHLGEHALQQGSKVDDDLLRFDFANPVGGPRRGTGRDRERGERKDPRRRAGPLRRRCRWPRPGSRGR